jgi:hypothetical protein
VSQPRFKLSTSQIKDCCITATPSSSVIPDIIVILNAQYYRSSMYVISSILNLVGFKHSSQHTDIAFTYKLSYSLKVVFNPYFSYRTAMSSSTYSREYYTWICLHISYTKRKLKNIKYRNIELYSSVIIPAHHGMFSKQCQKWLPSQSCSRTFLNHFNVHIHKVS